MALRVVSRWEHVLVETFFDPICVSSDKPVSPISRMQRIRLVYGPQSLIWAIADDRFATLETDLNLFPHPLSTNLILFASTLVPLLHHGIYTKNDTDHYSRNLSIIDNLQARLHILGKDLLTHNALHNMTTDRSVPFLLSCPPPQRPRSGLMCS